MALNDNILRPQTLVEFIGQENIKKVLNVFIYSAKKNNTCLSHMLFYGPPGLGKTSLAYVIANEMDNKIITVNANSIKEFKDLIKILGSIDEGNILFIDEIHKLDKNLVEVLYSAMEDYKINLPFNNSEDFKILDIQLSPFTLIGATTNGGSLPKPLRERFTNSFFFKYYDDFEISEIVKLNSKKLNINIDNNAAYLIALRSKKTPRIANNLLKNFYDYSIFKNKDYIDTNFIDECFNFYKIYDYGLNELDYKILKIMHEKYNDNPVSIEAICSMLNESPINIKEINEPFLVQIGLIERTKRGRKITIKGIDFLSKDKR